MCKIENSKNRAATGSADGSSALSPGFTLPFFIVTKQYWQGISQRDSLSHNVIIM